MNARVTLKLFLLLAALSVTGCTSSKQPEVTAACSGECEAPISTRYPVVLHHGFMGGKLIGHFRGAEEALTRAGYRVFLVETSSIHSIEVRGRQLAEQIEAVCRETGAPKVNIIAHSQGGLDARYAISTLGLGDKVASLTTLATPHRGTPIADYALRLEGTLAGEALRPFFRLYSEMANEQPFETDVLAAVRSLTETYMEQVFNRANPDVPGVYYQSWGARSGPGQKDFLKLAQLPAWYLISSLRGDNDGLVPESSARWGVYRGALDADHTDFIGTWALIGGGFDHVGFLASVIRELAEKGY